jgi:hypothetical protein
MSYLLRKTFFVICVIVSTLCLTVGYGIAEKWIGVVIAIITGLIWLLARKYPDSGLPVICLVVSVCLAVVGLLIGSPPLLMICGSGFALAVWDLVFLNNALGRVPSGVQTIQYERRHLQSLALALGSGLLVAFLGRLFNLQFPFLILMLFVAFIIFGLDRTYGYIKKRKLHIRGE